MTKVKKIPEAELEIMLIAWEAEEAVTSDYIMERLHKDWTKPTLLKLLTRLCEREFLRCDKRFLICSQSKWRYSHIEQKMNQLFKNNHNTNCIQLIMNLAKKESNFSILPQSCEYIFMPFIPNPFQLEPNLFHVFRNIIG